MTIAAHPEYTRIEKRLRALLPDAGALDEHLFRMINPRRTSAVDILSGEGGKRASGRWNFNGVCRCTYTTRTPESALAESLAAVRIKGIPDETALPRTLVCISARLERVLDLTNGQIRSRLAVSHDRMIGEPQWRTENYHDREAVTQAIGRAASILGYEALIAPSAANLPHGINVVIFPEFLRKHSAVDLITPI
jgi:RES domain-containing protein